jgi:hypothetical protein
MARKFQTLCEKIEDGFDELRITIDVDRTDPQHGYVSPDQQVFAVYGSIMHTTLEFEISWLQRG